MSLKNLPLFPDQASTMAARVDELYFFLIAVSAFFALLIFTLITVFVIRYRRAKNPRPGQIRGHLGMELLWTGIPFCLSMVMFVWGAKVYYDLARPPPDASEIYVVAKQWMWKFQHPEGPREINTLHVAVGRPVRLVMISEDVIHAFFVPAFRVKQDVLPGRYTSVWFEPTKVGKHHLFCSEYCGTSHSNMTGWVEVMEPADYERWLGGGATGETMASAGAKLFQQLGCQTCHSRESGARGPILDGQFGKPLQLTTGQTITMDDTYVRESILDPAGKIVVGYQPIMPTFKGLISEEQLLQLVAYIKSIGQEGSTGQPPAPPTQPMTQPAIRP